jgi:hypothetical protein
MRTHNYKRVTNWQGFKHFRNVMVYQDIASYPVNVMVYQDIVSYPVDVDVDFR